MASNVVRMAPSAMPPQPSQQDWVWDGANWTWCGPPAFPSPPSCPPPLAPPFPCPPPGFPTPCPPWFPPPAAQAPWYPGANGGVTFSAATPVNPIRGNFWWNGTILQMFDGAAWVSIGPSVATGITGVTDGSNAAPGQVGEFITSSNTFSYAAYPANTTQNVSSLVVQPGDWDLNANMTTSTIIGGADFGLNPQPVGVSSAMVAGESNISMTGTETAVLIAQAARASLTVPTLLAFTCHVYQNSVNTLPAGTATLVVTGRRRR